MSFRKFAGSWPPGAKKLCKFSTAAVLTSAGAWKIWSRHCYFEPFGPENDALFQSQYFSRFNPGNHISINDSCVRKVRLSQIQPELVHDALNGGSKLLEKFCGGVWGGYGYAIQRHILTWLWRNDSNKQSMLWDRKELLDSTYEEGTIVTDHFIVLEKTPRSIIMRGGESPSKDAPPREVDNISEITVDIDPVRDVVEFRLKNIFFNGAERTTKALFPAPIVWLHLQYCKLLVEAGVSQCVS